MKNQKNALINLVVIGITMFFYSCSTEQNEPPQNNVSTSDLESKSYNSSRVGISTPENANNPYDEVGVMHNVVIEKVMFNASNLVTTDDYINYAKTVSNDVYGINASNTVIPTNTQIKTIIDDHSADFSNVISNSGYSTQAQLKLTELVNLLLEADRDLSIDYNTLKRQIITFEDDLINDITLSNIEKQNILQMSSVARHSTHFWYNIMLDTIDYNETLSPNVAKKKWWKWAVVGVADVLGAIGGASFGSPTGIVAIGMAVIGSAGASGGAATVLNYFWPDPAPTAPAE
uniref:hypothetical protein n=1 Tax=Flavobacterium sp. TaxID=239 RepID=UPI004049B8A1